MEGSPNAFFQIALAAFVPITFASLWLLGPRRGVIASLLGGWLFLPTFFMSIGPPMLHNKAMFVPAVVLAASLVLDARRWFRFRPVALDIPVAILCVGPFITALANNLGGYEASSAAFSACMTWGAPYLLARVYLGRPPALREFAIGIVMAALVYVPFCLWEVRMSPHLHQTFYGYSTFGRFATVMRYGGYRPTVFAAHGLALGMFMAVGSLVAWWMWRTGSWKRVAGIPSGWVVGLLVVTTLLCKSTGAIFLLVAGLAALEAARRLRTPVLILVLLVVPVAYSAARVAGWSGRELVTAAEKGINPQRAQSVDFRLENEDMLLDKAMKRPWFGWGRFGRSRVYDDETGRDLVVTDGMWIIDLGIHGFVGLAALWMTLALPVLALLRRFPVRQWGDSRLAPAAALGVASLLWAIDGLFNSMMSPVFPAIVGAVISFCIVVSTARVRRRAERRTARGRLWQQGHAS